MIDLQPSELRNLQDAARAHPLLLESIASPPEYERVTELPFGEAPYRLAGAP